MAGQCRTNESGGPYCPPRLSRISRSSRSSASLSFRSVALRFCACAEGVLQRDQRKREIERVGSKLLLQRFELRGVQIDVHISEALIDDLGEETIDRTNAGEHVRDVQRRVVRRHVLILDL